MNSSIQVFDNDYDDNEFLELEFEGFMKRMTSGSVLPRQKKNVSFNSNEPEVFLLDYTLDRRPELWSDINFYSVYGSPKTKEKANRKLALRHKTQNRKELPMRVKELDHLPHGFNHLNHVLCTSLECKKCSHLKREPFVGDIHGGDYDYRQSTISTPLDFITEQLDPKFIEGQIIKTLKEREDLRIKQFN